MPILKPSSLISETEQQLINTLNNAGIPVSQLLTDKLLENPVFINDHISLLIEMKKRIGVVNFNFFEIFATSLSHDISESNITKWRDSLSNIDAIVEWFIQNNYAITPALSAYILADPDLILPIRHSLTNFKQYVPTEEVNGKKVFDENFLALILTELDSLKEKGEIEANMSHIFNLEIPINQQALQDSDINKKEYALQLMLAVALLKWENKDINDVVQNALGQSKIPLEFAQVYLTLSHTDISLEKNIPNILEFVESLYGYPLTFAEDYANGILQLSQNHILTNKIFQYYLRAAEGFGDALSNALINLNNEKMTLDDDVLTLLNIKPKKSELMARAIILWNNSGLLNEANKKLLTRPEGLKERIVAIQRFISAENPLNPSQWKMLFDHSDKFDQILKCLYLASKNNVNISNLSLLLINNIKYIDTIYDAMKLLGSGQQVISEDLDAKNPQLTSEELSLKSRQLTLDNIEKLCSQDGSKYAVISAVKILSQSLTVSQFDKLMKNPMMQDIKNIANSATAFASFQKQQPQSDAITNIPQLPLRLIAASSGRFHLSQQSSNMVADAYFTRNNPDLLEIFSPQRYVMNKLLSAGIPITDKLKEKLLQQPQLVEDFASALIDMKKYLEEIHVAVGEQFYEMFLTNLSHALNQQKAVSSHDYANNFKDALISLDLFNIAISPSLMSCLLAVPEQMKYIKSLFESNIKTIAPLQKSNNKTIYNEQFLTYLADTLNSNIAERNIESNFDKILDIPIDPQMVRERDKTKYAIDLITAVALLKWSNSEMNDLIQKKLGGSKQPLLSAEMCLTLPSIGIALNAKNSESIIAFTNDTYGSAISLQHYKNNLKILSDGKILTDDIFRFLLKVKQEHLATLCKTLVTLHTAHIKIDNDVLTLLNARPEKAAITATRIIAWSQAELLNDTHKKLLVNPEGLTQRVSTIQQLSSIPSSLDQMQRKKLFDYPDQFDRILSCLLLAQKANINSGSILNILVKNINHIDTIYDAMNVLSKGGQLTIQNLQHMCDQNNGRYALIYAVERTHKSLLPDKFKQLMTDPLMNDIKNIINSATAFASMQKKEQQTGSLTSLGKQIQLKIAGMSSSAHLTEQSAGILADAYLTRNSEITKIFSMQKKPLDTDSQREIKGNPRR